MNNIIKRKWNQNSMVIIEDLQGMAFQAESGGHTFQISGIDGEGNTVALSGTPAGVMLRADGQDVTLTCSVSGGVVSATLPANAYSVPGRFGLTIFLTSDGQKTAIYAAVGTVGKTSSGTVAPPAGSDVVDLVNAIATAVATIPASYTDLMASVAPTYSSSGLYAVGSYAWYNGKLYRCTTAIISGETWTSGHWTLANLGSDLVDLKSAFNATTSIVKETIPYTYDNKCYLIGDSDTNVPINSPTNLNNYECIRVACEPNDLFFVTAKGQSRTRPYAFIKANGDIIAGSRAPENATVYNAMVVAPSEAAYFVGNNYKSEFTGKVEKYKSNQIMCFRGFINELGYTKLSDCRLSGWYGCSSAYLQGDNVEDLPDGFPKDQALHLVVYAPATANENYIRQEVSTRTGESWKRQIIYTGTVQNDWTRVEPFKFNGFINSLGYTSLAQCREAGWYGCTTNYIKNNNITDLPIDFEKRSIHLKVYVPATGNLNYIRQELSHSDDANIWVRVIDKNGETIIDWVSSCEVFASRPSNGYENFTFPISTGIPNDASESIEIQDSDSTANDRAILILPTTYKPTGKPTRLLIIGAGTGGLLSSSSADISTNCVIHSALALAEGYAILQTNATVTAGATKQMSHGSPMSLRSYVAAYKYVTEKYNIAKDGVFVAGYSQGGLRTLQLAISQVIPVKAAVAFAPSVDMWKSDYTLFGSDVRQLLLHDFGFVEKVATPETVKLFPSLSGQIVEAPTEFNEAGYTPNEAERAYIINNMDKWTGYNPFTAKISGTTPEELYRFWTRPSGSANTNETDRYNKGSIHMPCPVKIYGGAKDNKCPMKWLKSYFDMLVRGGSIAEYRELKTVDSTTQEVNGITHDGMALDMPSVSMTAKNGETVSDLTNAWEAMLFFRRWNI